MLSRETAVHAVIVAVTIVSFVLLDRAGVAVFDGPSAAVAFVAFYAILLGGAHLVFALQGVDGMIPVDARWRYLAALVVVLGGSALVFYGEGLAVGPLELSTLGYAIVAVTVIGYVVIEGVAGYRATQTQTS
ncbi:hypothetical protein ACLI4U_08635 [Natrialbaceae archaeon A-CW2]|uniref:hypothetical protein n=1 Tax=Natronosalvus amylolyticus TaxID=2961994 RepID=UPI0020C9ECC3|nr:hypothetical protein [Natronosalvus amylolyticus]